MILKFDKPITIEEARELYNDKVKFISSVDSYPHVEAIEFNVDPRIIFKRKAVSPKVTKKANKIIDKYSKKLEKIWDSYFKSIALSVGPQKQESVKISDANKRLVNDILDSMMSEIKQEARDRFEEAYILGKNRGQISTNQELDDDLTDEDRAVIEDRLDRNEEYLAIFSSDLQRDMDRILTEQTFDSHAELEDAIREEIQEPKKSRALMYPMAILGLIAAGMIHAMNEADPDLGHRKIRGGFWTIHPEEGKGGEVCEGCLENSGKWFTIQEFEKEYQTNNCLTRCRCDLDTV